MPTSLCRSESLRRLNATRIVPEVRLRRGCRRSRGAFWAFMLSLFCPSFLHAEQAVALAVSVGTAATSFEPKGLMTVVATPISEPSGSSFDPVRAVLTAVPGAVTLKLPVGVVWRVEVEGEDVWSTYGQFLSEPPEGQLGLSIYPRSAVAFTVQGLKAAPPGNRVMGRVRSAPEAPLVPPAVVPCTVSGNRVLCPVPATPIDLAVKLPGYSGLYFWDLTPPAGTQLDAGTRELHAGSSLVAWVVTESGAPLAGARVRLEPEAAGSTATPDFVAELRASPQIQSNSRGFVQFVKAPTGPRRLAVSTQTLGEAVMTGLNLLPDTETEIARPIVVQPPQRVEFRISPSSSPAGDSWVLRLNREDVPGRHHFVASRTANAEGRAVFPRVSAGHYLAELQDASSNRLAWQPFDVPGSPLVEIEVDLVPVEGKVTLGGRPLAADLWFGGRTGAPRIEMLADDEGQYLGTLPGEGFWRVDVSAPGDSVERRISGVEVRRRTDGMPTVVDFELPDTELSGRVVDEEGRPAPGSAVQLAVLSENNAFFVRADEDGEFRFRGLGLGSVLVSAEGMTESGPGTATPVEVLIEKTRTEPKPIELVLRLQRSFRGRVIGAFGEPVARASVTAEVLAGGRSASVGLTSTLSSLDGAFDFPIPPDADEVLLYVGAGGGALRARRFAARAQGEIVVPLDRGGGEIRLELAQPLGFGDPEASLPLLFQDGVALPIGVLFVWSRANGQPFGPSPQLVIPNMASADYSFCLLTAAERQAFELAQGSFAPGPKCKTGYLAAGGVLEVHLP